MTGAAAVFGSLLFSLYAYPRHDRILIDFYKAYLPAGQAMLNGDYPALLNLYELHLFVNIPVVAWFFAPFAALDLWWAGAVFTVFGVLCIAATVYLLTRDTAEARPRIVSLFFLNGPLWYSIWMGNTTHMVLLCMAVALSLWWRGWLYLTGVLFGVAAIIKPALLIFGAYFIIRRKWRVVLGGTVVVLGAVAVGIVILGIPYTGSWYQNIIVEYARHPIGAYNSQSLANFLLRMETGAKYLHDWGTHPLSSFSGSVRYVVMSAMGAVVLLATAQRRESADGRPGSHEFTEVCLLLSIFVMLGTISWTHYYLLLLLPWTLYFTGKLHLPDDRWSRGLIWASILFCSLPVHFNRYPDGFLAKMMPRLLDSAWFIGAIFLFLALARGILLNQANPIRSLLAAGRTK